MRIQLLLGGIERGAVDYRDAVVLVDDLAVEDVDPGIGRLP